MNTLTLNFPTLLTLSRLIISPLVLPLLFAELLPLNIVYINCLLALVFVLVSLTDFFDGYLARRYRQETFLGRLLDPIADKFLLYSTLIALVHTHKIYFFWAIIFIGREFFIMGLREVAVSYGFSLQVSSLAKLKTAVQMAYLTYVIINPSSGYYLAKPLWNIPQYILLCMALYLTLASAAQYYIVFAKNIRGLE